MIRMHVACALLACLLAFPAAAGEPVPAPPVARGPFKLFFQVDSVELAPDSAQVIDSAARAVMETRETRVAVMGFADRVGSAGANLRLSRRRAEAVKAALIARGVPAAVIYVLAFGEGGQAAPTADELREPRNRFVTITLGYPVIPRGMMVDYLGAVFFDTGSARITEQGSRMLDAAASWTVTPMREIVVAGHADRVGSSSSNLNLSRRRAEAVKAALVERGVPAVLISTEAYGEGRLLVETADGVAEPQNRSVYYYMEPVERWRASATPESGQ
jgi:outer membrane protein OmpA-like peptidoglycan-associated protein